MFFAQSFGGAYYIDDSFYINIKKQYKKNYEKYYDFEVDVHFIEVTYSYKELEKGLKKILDSGTINGYEYGIDVKENVIEFSTDLNQVECEELLEKIGVLEMTKVEYKVNTYETYSINVINGSGYALVAESAYDSWCSVGFPAKNSSGVVGFVTAGHCVEHLGLFNSIYVKYNDVIIGKRASYIFETRATADAAFIKFTNSQAKVTNQIYGSSKRAWDVLTSRSYVMEGRVVWFSGKNSSTVGYGTITQDYKVNLPIGGVYLDDLFSADVAVSHGDSGGVLLIDYYEADIFQVKVGIIGILSGEGWFSRTQNIFNELNLTEYSLKYI